MQEGVGHDRINLGGAHFKQSIHVDTAITIQLQQIDKLRESSLHSFRIVIQHIKANLDVKVFIRIAFVKLHGIGNTRNAEKDLVGAKPLIGLEAHLQDLLRMMEELVNKKLLSNLTNRILSV